MIKKVLISQPAPTSPKSPYFDLEEKHNVHFEFRPLVHVERYSEKEFRAQRINILDYSAVIFNTRHAIDNFFSLCKDLRVTVPDDMKYFFISEKIALYIQKYIQYRKRKIFFARTGKMEELLELMVKHKKEKFLFPQNEAHHNDFKAMLDQKELNHTECNMFRTVCSTLDKAVPFDYDMVVFFTPTGVKAIKHNFPDYQQGETKFACWGKAAAETVEEEGYRLDLQAPTPEAPSIITAIDNYLSKEAKSK